MASRATQLNFINKIRSVSSSTNRRPVRGLPVSALRAPLMTRRIALQAALLEGSRNDFSDSYWDGEEQSGRSSIGQVMARRERLIRPAGAGGFSHFAPRP